MTRSGIWHIIYRLVIDQGYSQEIALWANLLISLLVIGLLLYLSDKISRRFILLTSIFSKRTKTTFDDYLFRSNFPRYLSRLLPFYIFKYLIESVIVDFPNAITPLEKITDIIFIVLVVFILRSIIRSFNNYLKTFNSLKDKPIDSFSQVIIIVMWIIAGIFIISILVDKSVVGLLTALGAISAIVLLVFKDTILGFVASIQVSMYDMVRIGDWVTIEQYGADGDVLEINLTTVKVQNFDNTISTVPTYSLISGSFKNWRGMKSSGGRRISRNIYLKQERIRFLDDKDIKRFSEIQIIAEYIAHRQKDIDEYNKNKEADNKTLRINGRNQTNLGLFRKYCDLYLHNHPALNKKMTLMVRHLAPTSYGIPLQIYCFSSDKVWVNYEHIMADIFEHIIASVSYFDLEISELNTLQVDKVGVE